MIHARPWVSHVAHLVQHDEISEAGLCLEGGIYLDSDWLVTDEEGYAVRVVTRSPLEFDVHRQFGVEVQTVEAIVEPSEGTMRSHETRLVYVCSMCKGSGTVFYKDTRLVTICPTCKGNGKGLS